MIYSAARFIVAVVVIWTASLKWPDYTYYMVLRTAVFLVTAYGAYQAWQIKDRAWLWTFLTIAVLFNPIPGLVVHLTRPIWVPINLATGIALLISLDGKLFALSPGSAKETSPTKIP